MACEIFAGLGAPVCDADALAREAVAAGRPAFAEIIASFGREALGSDGRLNRTWLRGMVFADEGARRRLERIVHPCVRAMIFRCVESARAPYVLLCIPLLAETAAYARLIDRTLVVDCAPETQIARVTQRDHLTRAEVEAIMRAQATRTARINMADDVIHNDGTPRDLEHQVRALHERLLAAAADRSG
jgi:dephospho-CoA kinase